MWQRSWASSRHSSGQNKSFFYEKRSRVLATSYVEDKDKFIADNDNVMKQVNVSEDDFLNLFYGGELSDLEPLIQGYKPEGKGAYKVTFTVNGINDDKFKSFEKDLLLALQNGIIYKNAKQKRILIKIYMPRSPKKTITLRPVPIEYDLDDLRPVLKNWGNPCKVTRGLHRQIGERRRLENEYVHVQYNVNDLNENLIPQFFELEGHYVYVSKPNESLKIQCGYCHGYWHSEDLCYKKKRDTMQAKKCSYCGLDTHDESDCMQKLMDTQQEQDNLEKQNGCQKLLTDALILSAGENKSAVPDNTSQGQSLTSSSIVVAPSEILPVIPESVQSESNTPTLTPTDHSLTSDSLSENATFTTQTNSNENIAATVIISTENNISATKQITNTEHELFSNNINNTEKNSDTEISSEEDGDLPSDQDHYWSGKSGVESEDIDIDTEHTSYDSSDASKSKSSSEQLTKEDPHSLSKKRRASNSPGALDTGLKNKKKSKKKKGSRRK